MLFNSNVFIFAFLPLVLLGYYLLCRLPNRASYLWLVCASLFFYGWWNPKYLILILVSMVFNFAIGRQIQRGVDTQRKRTAKWWLILGIVLNLGALAYFKYFDFFVGSINGLFGSDFNFRNIILPLAISFFTFQQITYLVDTFKQKCAHYDFLSYALFVSFFPQLIAGPIVHHSEMMPQFQQKSTRILNWNNLSVGLAIFLLGLFKKVILADQVAQYGTPMFDAALVGAAPGVLEAWTGVLAYTLQLYFDFSGYSDMAIGLARMFGILLPQNFNSPYHSLSIIEFWRRWHMTLSRFLRDYLYIAMGGNRLGDLRRYFNLMTTMLIGGLWHGAAWTFVVWGGLHGTYLLINHAWRQRVSWQMPRFLAWSITLVAVMVAWVFFRAESFSAANTIVAGMIGFNGAGIPEGYRYLLGPLAGMLNTFPGAFVASAGVFSFEAILWITVCGIVALFFPNTQEVFKHFSPAHNFTPESHQRSWWHRLEWQPTTPWLIITIVLAAATLLSLNKPSEFLYFQF